MKEKIVGTLEAISNTQILRTGTTNKVQWTLFGIKIISNANTYTLSGFDKNELDKQVEGLSVGNLIEFEIEKNDKGYWNIVNKSLKKIAENKTVGQPEFKPATEIKIGIPELPPLDSLASIASSMAESFGSNISVELEIMKAKVAIFNQLLESEYAWRTARYIQACKEKNMENFRR